MGTHDKIVRGNMAEIGLEVCKNYCFEKREILIGELKNMYRKGESDAPQLFAKAAAITVLDDMIADLTRRVVSGQKQDTIGKVDNGTTNQQQYDNNGRL